MPLSPRVATLSNSYSASYSEALLATGFVTYSSAAELRKASSGKSCLRLLRQPMSPYASMSASLPGLNTLRSSHAPRSSLRTDPERAPASRRWGPAWPGHPLHQYYATMGGADDSSRGGAGGGSGRGVVKISRGRPVNRARGMKQVGGGANGAELWAHSSTERAGETAGRTSGGGGVRGRMGGGASKRGAPSPAPPWLPTPHSLLTTPHEGESSLLVPPSSRQPTRPGSVVDSTTATLFGSHRAHSPIPPVPAGQMESYDEDVEPLRSDTWHTRPISSPFGSAGPAGSMLGPVLLPLSSLGASRAATPIRAVRPVIAPEARPRTVPDRSIHAA